MIQTRGAHASITVTKDDIDDIARVFKALSDVTRIMIISHLTSGNRYSVSEIAEKLNMEISRISHQLTKLEDMGFIKGIRKGRNIYYEIKDECIRTILKTAKDHVAGK